MLFKTGCALALMLVLALCSLGFAQDAPDYEADVIVVGAGGAGLAAAITAGREGASVILLEKLAFVGGNTLISSGAMRFASEEFPPEAFFEQIMKGGDFRSDAELAWTIVSRSTELPEWMAGVGAPHTVSGNVLRAAEGRGADVIQPMQETAVELGVDIRLNTKAVGLMKDDAGTVNRVVTVDPRTGEEMKVFGARHGVIMATGGYAASTDILARYRPDLVGIPSTNNAQASTGEGIYMAMAVGAVPYMMDYVQVHPTAYTTDEGRTGLVTEGMRGQGAILVNSQGERFTNENDRRDVVTAAIMDQGGYAYLIFEENFVTEISENVPSVYAALNEFRRAEVVHKSDSPAELAEAIGVPADSLEATIDQYNEYVDAGADPEFDKPSFPVQLDQGPYRAIRITPATHYTMGGIRVDADARVLDNLERPIPGLFAAGEIITPIHGTNRIGGNAITNIIVGGIIAGENVVK